MIPTPKTYGTAFEQSRLSSSPCKLVPADTVAARGRHDLGRGAYLVLAVLLFPILALESSAAVGAAPVVKRAEVTKILAKVADWQLAHPGKEPLGDWVQGPFLHGLFALGAIPGEGFYLNSAEAIGRGLDWQVMATRHPANDHCSAQTWLDLYALRKDPKMLAPVKRALDKTMADHAEADEDMRFKPENYGKWSWCDALYMAPPTFARLGKVTGDRRYFDYLHKWWWLTSKTYYSEADHLFFRDDKYMGQGDAPRVYWGRGNGWVFGGLVRVLEVLPKDDPVRPRYERQFREMAARLLEIQQADGLWGADLLNPQGVPGPESSGSGFFIYGLAWGINEGLLDPRLTPAVLKAWTALAGLVREDGQLTRVQPIGESPYSFDPNSTMPYGVGAFLLAGSEVWQLAK
jgi:rhamnogalacturonyl hydrolase YesR